jgi:hypothetical protein
MSNRTPTRRRHMDNQSTDTSSELKQNKIIEDGNLNLVRSIEVQLRMECLQLAVRGREGGEDKKIVAVAKTFEKFVTGEE